MGWQVSLRRLFHFWERTGRGTKNMEAYEFYWLDPKGGYKIIGVLHERRKNPARVTKESIMQWGENIFGKDFDTKDIFFIPVTIDEKTVGIFRPIPFPMPNKTFKK